MSPQSLNVVGSTQPEIFQGTVDDMVQAIRAHANQFWRESLRNDGPIEIWEIGGERFLFNGNHRYQAAVTAGADIPNDMVMVRDRTGSAIPTFRIDQLVWLPGRK
jgi:hypothetical protein